MPSRLNTVKFEAKHIFKIMTKFFCKMLFFNNAVMDIFKKRKIKNRNFIVNLNFTKLYPKCFYFSFCNNYL